ncbi:ribonuclease P protein component [Corynebacterium variabile]|uniref:ribonuclease P protein component n=1 Tax=Actinomycetes TaxID=1760 RepID=UPI002649B48F|nr:ribonuclease P protein component [Corynebacterium variabile]MDN6662582.1 ribonuclease P protein component [Corynebacterium variabile]
MLPARCRVHRPGEFRGVTHRGVRAGRSTLVVHASRTGGPGARDGVTHPELSTASVDNSVDAVDSRPRVGFIVSKAVGNAVTRNRVKRRLRHLSRDLLGATPDHTLVVVRALPAASTSPESVPGDLADAWRSAMRKVERDRRRSADRSTSARPSGAPAGGPGTAGTRG